MRNQHHLRLLQASFAGILLLVAVWTVVLMVVILGQTSPETAIQLHQPAAEQSTITITTGLPHQRSPIRPIPTSALPPVLETNYYYPNQSSGHSLEGKDGGGGGGVGGFGGRRRNRRSKMPKGLSDYFIKAYTDFSKLRKLRTKLKAAKGKNGEEKGEKGEDGSDKEEAGGKTGGEKAAKKAVKKATKKTVKALKEWWKWMGEQDKVEGMLKKEKEFGMKMAKKLNVKLDGVKGGDKKGMCGTKLGKGPQPAQWLELMGIKRLGEGH